MLISKKIFDYVIYEEESIVKALEKINKNKKRITFIISEDGKLVGSLSDGDFRRWITKTKNYDLNNKVSSIKNLEVTYSFINSPRVKIQELFTSAIDCIPLLDESSRIVALAFSQEKGIVIGEHSITENSPSFIIAEIGNNHNGDISLAKELVELAVKSGADCVKFQMRDMGALYKSGKNKDNSADLGAQYTMDLLRKFQLTNNELLEVFDFCKSLGLTPLCTPWDLKSLEVLEQYGMEAYKVASADFTNHELLEALARTGKPLICSTGMSTEIEIKKSAAYLKSLGVEAVILHCNSTYPTPFKDVNLAYLPRLKEITDYLVGYSGHERGISVPIAAVALGARVVEKHFTIDKEMEGNDHKVSLLPPEFAEMTKGIREVEESYGISTERVVTQGEMINREVLAKSLIINQELKSGQVITREMVEIKSPGQGLQPCYLEDLLGRKAKRDFLKGGYFFESDLQLNTISSREYSFDRPFGIPVRYHDYKKLTLKSNFDFVEFHLSYQDLDLNLNDFFTGTEKINFAVHSPELFENDHIMDLASTDDEYRNHSISELNRVCGQTRKLKSYFPSTDKPVIVINAGGFSTDGFIAKEYRDEMYERVAESLNNINQEGIEIIIQTMPPFPWHFGGQSFHNIFVDPDEISKFCSKYNYRICYDTSHSMMACSYYRWDLHKFTEKVSRYIAHMHIVDALGSDGEGIQIGKGDVNFRELGADLNNLCPEIMFLPEVWQGHKNEGEGFWQALEFLEDFL
jgi:N-acetylneuraminate synthase